MTPKTFGHVGVLESATSPAGNIGLLFGYDYDRGGGKPHLAALMSWQDARAMAQHILSLTQPHADAGVAAVAGKPVPALAVTAGKDRKFNPNAPAKPPTGKELVRKPEPEQKRVRVRKRRP